MKPLGALANAAKAFVLSSTVLALLDVPIEVYLISEFDRDRSVFEISHWTDFVYLASGLVMLIAALVYVVAGVVVLALLKRMANNGAKIVPKQAIHKSHWVITGWFVPVLNLFRPYHMVKQIWVTSRSSDPRHDEFPGYAEAWWGLLIASAVVLRFMPTAPFSGAVTMDQLADEAIGNLVLGLLTTAAGILFYRLLGALIDRHERALERPWIPSTAPPPTQRTYFPSGSSSTEPALGHAHSQPGQSSLDGWRPLRR